MKVALRFFFLISFNCSFAQTTPAQMIQNMGRGINLGNTLSAPVEGNWAPAVLQTYFQDIAALGFNTVRIPIRFDNQTTLLSSVNYEDVNGNYIGSPSDYTVNATYLNRIEEVTDWALAEGLIAIIDVHGDNWYWGSYNSADAHYKTGNDRLAVEDRFKAIWNAISIRFQNKNDNLLFEIMNEAYFDMSNAEVETTYNFILPIIRTTNPTRNVIVTGGGNNSWQSPLQLTSSFISGDDYLIATFHYYIPFNFTSSSRPDKNDFDWGTAADLNTVDTHFDNVLNWSIANNIPVFLGEFGADNTNGYNYFTETDGEDGGPDNASRIAYHDYLSQGALDRGFSFAVWDAGEKSNKTLFRYTGRQWVKDVRHVLLDPTCNSSDLINNENIECGYDWNWELQTSSSSVANLYTASLMEGRNNTQSSKIEVTTASGTLNSVILKNDSVTSASLSNKDYQISCFAKASGAGQQFRMRLKATVNGSIQFINSPQFNLTTNFTQFSHIFSIPENTTEIQFQVLVGKQTGVYFFDDFESIDTATLSISNYEAYSIKLFPNPVSEIIFIKSENKIHEIVMTDILGKSINYTIENNQFKIPEIYNDGLYFIKVINSNNEASVTKKIILNRK